jgi:hypothetical protein
MAKPDAMRQAIRAASEPQGHTTTGVTMKALSQSLKIIALATGVLAMSACASLDASQSAAVPAAKVDSGLGELPHYRDWVDPSGRMPTQVMTASDSTR